MSRPRTYDKRIGTCIRLPEDMHRVLQEAAAERDVSLNWLVTRALEDFLPRLTPVDEIMLTRPAVRKQADG